MAATRTVNRCSCVSRPNSAHIFASSGDPAQWCVVVVWCRKALDTDFPASSASPPSPFLFSSLHLDFHDAPQAGHHPQQYHHQARALLYYYDWPVSAGRDLFLWPCLQAPCVQWRGRRRRGYLGRQLVLTGDCGRATEASSGEKWRCGVWTC